MPTLKQQIRFCRSPDGARIAYATSGRGPPLVKAANWMSHLQFDVDSPVWGHVLAELARGHTLVRYDERGCGLSDRDVADLSFDAWVRDLETVVNAAGAERFPLLGISQGASIAVAYAARHPERVSHLILHGGYARGELKRNITPQQREEAETMNKLAELGWGRENPAFRQFFTTQYIPGGTAPWSWGGSRSGSPPRRSSRTRNRWPHQRRTAAWSVCGRGRDRIRSVIPAKTQPHRGKFRACGQSAIQPGRVRCVPSAHPSDGAQMKHCAPCDSSQTLRGIRQ